MIEKTEQFKQLIDLLKVYQDLSDVQIVADIKTEDKVFQFAKNKLKQAGN